MIIFSNMYIYSNDLLKILCESIFDQTHRWTENFVLIPNMLFIRSEIGIILLSNHPSEKRHELLLNTSGRRRMFY